VRLNEIPGYLATGLESRFWPPYSRLMIKGDRENWSLYWDAVELAAICRKLSIPLVDSRYRNLENKQCVFNVSRHEFLEHWQKPASRIAFPYYHGNPANDPVSRNMLKTISMHHQDIGRIQVSCRFMEEVTLNTGIGPEKVFRIPIGINRTYFTPTTPQNKQAIRQQLGIPGTAVVVGSFQKDGNGWKDGMEPKMIKGPDIFLKTIASLKSSIPELFILLTGPARGYVRNGLEKMGVPYVHHFLNDYTDIGRYFNALDAYIIPSRDEGGPKAVLEAMASGTPLISTRVGQATDLVLHQENGFLADIDDAGALAHWTLSVLEQSELRTQIIARGLATAKENDYSNQLPLWQAFMHGFVETSR